MQARQLTVLSGKGGTGKTSLLASFAALTGNAVLADCDVDAPNLPIVLKPSIERESQFVGGKMAYIDPSLCIACGQCEPVCRFDAISPNGPGNRRMASTFIVDWLACEGCTVCERFCSEGAIRLVPSVDGEWFVSQTRHGPMIHARLGAGRANSGKLVSLIRQEARTMAERESAELILCDGPPGIGCPAIASLTGVDIVLIAVEPTVSGVHDFERVAKLAAYFKVPALVCVNKHDINEEMTERVESVAQRLGIETVGRIPYDEAVIEAQMNETSVVEHRSSRAADAITNVWEHVKARLESVSV